MKVYLFLTIILLLYYSVIPVPATPLMYIRLLEGLTEGEYVGIDYEWEFYNEISPHFFRAVIAAEDGRFLRHTGVDWRAVKHAEAYNKRYKGKKLLGASTITMQTARNVLLWQERSWIRKSMEVFNTILIELYWPKKRTLEVYANIVELGEGVYGVGAASEKYFGKPAEKLTKREAALLAAALPQPLKRNPAKPTSYLKRRASRIQARMGGVALPKDD